MDFADVERVAQRWPEVERSTVSGTPALKVRGRSFCRMWGPREHARDGVTDTEVLVVFCDPHWKESLIESSGGVLFSTPHYDGYGAMLVRLREVSAEELREYLRDSYRLRAPAALRARLGQ